MTDQQQPRTLAQRQFERGKYDQSELGTRSLAAAAMYRAEEVATDLGAQIAELRDTVDELSSKFSNANDVIDRRLTALESPASAPEFAPDPNNKRTRPRTSITDDIEELWPQLEAGIRYLGRKSEPEPPAAVPEPEPDPLCQCGHAARWHNDHKRKCNHVESLRPYVRCACEQFVPQPSPATAHQEPPDAVLVAIISDAKRRWSRDDYGTETQDEEIALSVTEYFRNKYGRDGAR